MRHERDCTVTAHTDQMTTPPETLPDAGVAPLERNVRPRAWLYTSVAGASVVHTNTESARFRADMRAAREYPDAHSMVPLYDRAAIDAALNRYDDLHSALTELRDRIKGHPAYASLTEDEEIDCGGDTAELSYLARVADAALGA